LLIEFCDPNLNTNNNRRTPLHLAAKYGHIDTVKLLIEEGALINKTDLLGRTPLHLAAKYGYIDTVKLLIEKGAHMKMDWVWMKPLHLATKANFNEVAQFLRNAC
tara:strand:- start:169 stop:483 length:315 start_codon:yes stop_codon:yes gene_type:complete